MRVLWMSAFRLAVQQPALGRVERGAQWTGLGSWRTCPPQKDVKLKLGNLWSGGTERKSSESRGALSRSAVSQAGAVSMGETGLLGSTTFRRSH